MNEFGLWLSTGFEHISDWQAYDHMLFVSLLVMAFPMVNWTKLLISITAFTVGHSVSLALSVITNFEFSISFIEFLISLSILVTAIFELVAISKQKTYSNTLRYMLVIVFGSIHGLGFSILLKSMLGKEESVFLPLMYFNVGLELGQLVIVGIVLVFSLFITKIFKWNFTTYRLSLILLIGLIALKLSVERFLLFFA